MGGIYAIKNTINGKVYIGSAKNFKKRWKRHRSQLKNNKHHSIKLQRSYNKYGKDSFEFIILEECENRFERELHWINKHNSYTNGYNIGSISGGDNLSNNPNKTEICNNISKGLKKYYETLSEDERKEKYGKPGELNGRWNPENHNYCDCGKRIQPNYNSCINCYDKSGENNPFFGKTHSDKTKEKLSKSRLGKIPSNARKIIIDDIIYNSPREASDKLNIPTATIRHRCCSNNKKFHNYLFLNA